MRLYSLALFAVFLLFGCTASQRDSVPKASTASECEAAIEVIATSNDRNEVNAAYHVVFYSGRTAVDAWQEHLDDQRTIDGTFCTRSLNGGTFTIAQQSFWAIQGMIEETRPPRTSKSYYVLSESNVNDWLDKRQGLRLVELKIEAASRSLQLAETDFELTGSHDAGQALQFYREILTSLRSQQ